MGGREGGRERGRLMGGRVDGVQFKHKLKTERKRAPAFLARSQHSDVYKRYMRDPEDQNDVA